MKEEKFMVKRKWRWYNKLLVLLKEKFKENVDYSVELRKRLLFSRFLYNQKVVLILSMLPVIILSVLLVYFYKNPSEQPMFSINFFDAVAVITTYLGTTFLAVIVWHNTWLQTREKENESAIRVHTEIEINIESNNCIFQHDDMTAININITNQSNCVPIKVEFFRAFELKESTVSQIQTRLVSYENNEKLLSFNETEKISVGLKKEMFALPKHVYFAFYISNAYGHQVFCIVDCALDKQGWCEDLYKSGTLIEVQKFKELKKEFGYNFLKEIVWRSPVGWKKRYINRIYLFKMQKKKEKKKREKKVKKVKTK